MIDKIDITDINDMTSIISSKKSIWVKGPETVTKGVLRTSQKGPAVEKIN